MLRGDCTPYDFQLALIRVSFAVKLRSGSYASATLIMSLPMFSPRNSLSSVSGKV